MSDCVDHHYMYRQEYFFFLKTYSAPFVQEVVVKLTVKETAGQVHHIVVELISDIINNVVFIVQVPV